MCLILPAHIVAVDSTDAIVEVEGRRRRASLLLQPDVQVDDWVLVAAGTVLRRIDADEAHELSRILSTAMAATPARTTPHGQGGPR